jgi:hypothetical protein
MLQIAGKGLASKRSFSDDERKQLANQGAAMPNGKYPITNGSDLQHAINLVGASDMPKDEVKAHIIARAKALGLHHKLPDSWSAQKREKAIGSFVSKKALKFAYPLDPNQSNPANTDTTQEDPTVDMIKNPAPYADVMRGRVAGLPGSTLQRPSTFGTPSVPPLNAQVIAKVLTPAA